MKIIYHILILLSCLFLPLTSVHAEYVLPYPSYMPGNKMYRITRLVDSMKKYWSYGSLTQVKYRMKLADKYLVEAKTLMEYKQYLLGYDALRRSNEQILMLKDSFQDAKKQYGNLEDVQLLITDELEKHIETVLLIQSLTPEAVVWNPEKAPSTDLNIADLLTESTNIRLEFLEYITK